MTRHQFIFVYLALLSAAIPLRAANRPNTGTAKQESVVWTNDDLKTLHHRGLISIIGGTGDEVSASETAAAPYVATDDPRWYAQQSAKLYAELGRTTAHLRQYKQALEDAQGLRNMTSGIDINEGDIGITPEAGIETLQRRISAEQANLDELEDLARHHDISPGTLRGQ
jgi:hypothetical protein